MSKEIFPGPEPTREDDQKVWDVLTSIGKPEAEELANKIIEERKSGIAPTPTTPKQDRQP